MSARAELAYPTATISNSNWYDTLGGAEWYSIRYDDAYNLWRDSSAVTAILIVGDYQPFNIPYDARVLGIELKSEIYLEPTCSANNFLVTFSLFDGVNWSGNQNAGPIDSTPTVYTIGHGGDWWAPTVGIGIGGPPIWTPQVFNDEVSFRLRLQAGSPKTPVCGFGHLWYCFVEYVFVYVYYKRPDDPTVRRAIGRMRTYK